MVRTLLVALLLMTCGIFLHAQENVFYYFDNITEKDGLSNNNITCFYKDKQGFMWIGTQHGLNRYDGSKMKVYMPSVQKKQFLSNGFITAIGEDGGGNTWVATRKGLNRIDKLHDTVTIFLPGKNYKTDGLPNDLLWDLYVQNDTAIWIAADGRDLSCYNQQTKQFHRYDYPGFIKEKHYSNGEHYHSILKIARKSEHELWLGTTDGIVSFNMLTGKFQMHYNTYFDHFTFFKPDPANNCLLFIEQKETFYRYNPADSTMAATAIYNAQCKTTNTAQDNAANYWLPSSNGIASIDANGTNLCLIRASVNSNLPEGQINTIYTDAEGLVWAGTGNGISKWLPRPWSPLLIKLPGIHADGEEFAPNRIAVATPSKEMFIAAPVTNKIYRISPQLETAEVSKPPQYQKDTCQALYYNNATTLYFLCRGKILIYTITTGQWKSLSLPDNQHRETVNTMQTDGQGNFWIGTKRHGLMVYQVKEKKWWLPSEKERFYGSIIHTLHYDKPYKTMWIGCFDYGLAQYNETTRQFTQHGTDLTDSTKLQSALINDITSDGKGKVWIATTEGGLSVFDYQKPAGKAFITQTVLKGLPDNSVYGVAMAGNKQAWFSTLNGMGIWDDENGLLNLYSQKNKFPQSEFFSKIIISDSNMITSYGDMLLVYNPYKAKRSREIPLFLEDITINDAESLHPLTSGNLQLTYKQNTLSFSFTPMDFISRQPVQYIYQLEGLDKNWVFAGTNNQVRYASLVPGNYIFKVIATDENKVAISKVSSFSFTILPPFWYRWWFIAACAGMLISVIIFLQKWRERNIHKKALEKSLIEKQVAELEIKALRSQMNPHFIFNSLNSISMLIANQQNEKSVEYLNKFSRLLRFVLDETENNFIDLKTEVKILDLYLQMERLRFGESFLYTITVDPALNPATIMIPALLVHPLVENAVWHGLLHKTGARRLSINFSKADKRLRCIVNDNGIGMEAAGSIKKQRLLEDGIRQKAKGLQIVRERLRMLEQQYKETTAFLIKDCYDEKGKVTGTGVTIEIPIVYES